MATLSLSDAKTYLNIVGTTHDAELTTIIDAAESAIAERVGPLTSTETTSRVRGGGTRLALPVMPTISLVSVTPRDGTALTLSDLYLDTGAAVVSYNSGAVFTVSYYTVVYNAGRTTCPADLLLAIKELVRHLWSTQRASAKRAGAGVSTAGEAAATYGAAYLFPYRIEQLITPHLQPGFA